MAEQPILVPEKAMVFIDAMNLYESLQGIGVDTKLDYYKFSLKLVGPQRRLIRAYVYTGAYDQAMAWGRCQVCQVAEPRLRNRLLDRT